MEPVFLGLEEVLEIHQDQIKRYGGEPGIRDIKLLQSALAQPQAGSVDGYFHEDIFAMAAAYLFHIVSNHPFIDGNKRTGAVAALVFLSLNDAVVEVDEFEYEKIVQAAAEGAIGKGKIAEFFSERSI